MRLGRLFGKKIQITTIPLTSVRLSKALVLTRLKMSPNSSLKSLHKHTKHLSNQSTRKVVGKRCPLYKSNTFLLGTEPSVLLQSARSVSNSGNKIQNFKHFVLIFNAIFQDKYKSILLHCFNEQKPIMKIGILNYNIQKQRCFFIETGSA